MPTKGKPQTSDILVPSSSAARAGPATNTRIIVAAVKFILEAKEFLIQKTGDTLVQLSFLVNAVVGCVIC
jgi:hypothetical protein